MSISLTLTSPLESTARIVNRQY